MSDPNLPNPDQPQSPQAPTGQPGAQQPYGQPGAQQPYAQPPQYAAPAAPLSAESDKQAAMWAHIGGIIGFLPSLIIWLLLKDRGPRTNVEAKEALNWQITFTIIMIGLSIVIGIINGVMWATGMWAIPPLLSLIPWAWWVVNVIFSIMGGVKVNGGGSYRYPFNFRFIK
ncbi:DUF4870 domain-containing protein [Microbacterium luticocti]|uniref:DUF4870 domain-containing protein n=1 Tax=Microbacterium luticocti TaxID=451764 RepID=UPI000429534B|nr:DUF4870 domain-containing protein [Microbacterium luticocti]